MTTNRMSFPPHGLPWLQSMLLQRQNHTSPWWWRLSWPGSTAMAVWDLGSCMDFTGRLVVLRAAGRRENTSSQSLRACTVVLWEAVEWVMSPEPGTRCPRFKSWPCHLWGLVALEVPWLPQAPVSSSVKWGQSQSGHHRIGTKNNETSLKYVTD